MASSNLNTPTKGGSISGKDAEFMYRVVQNMEGKPPVNWENVAKVLNYKSAGVAYQRFSQIKKKMDAAFDGPNAPGSGGDSVTPTKAPKAKANKVTKTPTKARDSKKDVVHPGKKGGKELKSAVFVTKEDDPAVEEDKEDDGDDHIVQKPKEVSDDDSYDMIEGEDEGV